MNAALDASISMLQCALYFTLFFAQSHRYFNSARHVFEVIMTERLYGWCAKCPAVRRFMIASGFAFFNNPCHPNYYKYAPNLAA